MKYKQYQKMKDSGVEWIGEIPEHWEVRPLQMVASVLDPFPSHRAPPIVDDGIPYPGIGDLDKNGNLIGSYRTVSETALKEQESRFKIDFGDLAFSRVATLGKIIHLRNDFRYCLSPTMAVLKPKINSLYLSYTLEARYFQEQLTIVSTGSTRYAVGIMTLRKLKVVLPPKEEQKQIDNFLQKETTQLDDLISKSKQQVNLLQEKRQALINHAVTKGLDPAVPMKDSGIEWIGEIPEHWESRKLKHVCLQIVDGVHKTPKYEDSGIPFISVNNFTGGKLDFSKTKFISKDSHIQLSKRCNPEKGDLILSKVGTLGQVDMIENEFEFSIFVQLALLKLNKEKLNPIFLKYFLKSDLIQTQIILFSNQTTLKYIGTNDIGLLPVFIPSMDEQQQIVEFLDTQTTQFDDLISKSQSQIKLLQEKRQAIITATVTGKIDVRK